MTTANEALQTETLIDVSMLAEKLSAHEVTIRRWQVSGKIPAPVRIGRSVKWRLSEIDEWIQADCPPRTKWEMMHAAAAQKSKRRT
jgi:predicted DNA-binding transcriptional regulator AlpA